MRWAIVLAVTGLGASCTVDRDLDPSRFRRLAPPSDGVPTCDPGFGPATACGGDPIATWSHFTSCGPSGFADRVTEVCAAAIVEAERHIIESFIVKRSTIELRDAFGFEVEFDATACGDCEMVPALYGARGHTVACQPQGQTCRCVLDETSFGSRVTSDAFIGTNQITGLQAVGADDLYFCVEGDYLIVAPICTGPQCEFVEILRRSDS
jgi:hypothetical protein